ncbi:MAG: hypothetical protein O3C57_04020 [Verrucomicrobia bacterium]|nr:hypothetical protein [Verrucomicrobiota bacterium]
MLGEELKFGDLNAEGEPVVGECLELLVGCEPVLNVINAIGSDEFADAATTAGKGEFGIGSVALWLVFAHALGVYGNDLQAGSTSHKRVRSTG